MTKTSIANTDKNLRSDCPIACALDIVGDRWSLLIVRDIFKKKSRFKDFLESEENYPSNILTDRLKRLEIEGIITREPYSERPPRFAYSLTSKGLELGNVIEAMYHWGNKNIFGKAAENDNRN